MAKFKATKGDNQFHGGTQNDVIDGGDGQDYLTGGGGNDRINGGDGNDSLLGDAGDDHLNGGGGSDTLFGGPGLDVYQGGSGDDVFGDYEDEGTSADVFLFETAKKGNFGWDYVDGFDVGSDQLRFVGYTAADVTVTTVHSDPSNSYASWLFEFTDGSQVYANASGGGGEGPMLDQDYVFV